MTSLIEYLSTVRSDRAGGIGEATVTPSIWSLCVFMVSYLKPPHRGGFVLLGVQRPDAPGRAVKTPPRLPALCVENHAGERRGRGTAPRASTGRARDYGSFLRSFISRQILSLYARGMALFHLALSTH